MVHKSRIEKMDRILHKNLRRRNEDIDYWRERAGWFDDDVSMKEFNSGVYDTYYHTDDDGAAHRTSSTSAVGGGGQGLSTFLKIGAAIVAVGLAVLLYRALSRRTPSTSRKVGSSKNAPSDSKTRSRSRSRSSRSRSRSRRTPSSAPNGTSASNYELMDEKSEARSRKSSRSRSRSRKNSKSRQPRARSKPRQNKEVLV
jgi:hypothetical protein